MSKVAWTNPVYHMSLSDNLSDESVECPVEGYRGWVLTNNNLQIHFVHHHVQETIVIMDEGKRPYPH